MYRERYIRFFISSTFVDMEHERNWLSEILSRLRKEYLQSEGWQVEYVDLRWGVSEKDGTDNRTMRVCLNELRRCQELSPRPNFIFLLGQRYGWMPLPEVIPNRYGEQIKQLSDLFEKFYRRDFNDLEFCPDSFSSVVNGCDPNDLWPWILQPFEENDNNNADTQNLNTEIEQLRQAIFSGLDSSGRDSYLSKLDTSATEQEIWTGALASNDITAHVVGYIRKLENIPDHAQKEIYAPEVNRDKLERLIHTVEQRVPSENILHSTLPFNVYESEAYKRAFTKEMEARIRKVIDSEIARVKAQSPLQVDVEIQTQTNFLNRLNQTAAYRASIGDEIDRYLFDQPDKSLLWLFGKAGSGKSTILAKAFAMVCQRNQDILSATQSDLYRFAMSANTQSGSTPTVPIVHPYYICCGLTQETSSAYGVVRVLYSQIIKAFQSVSRLRGAHIDSKTGLPIIDRYSFRQLRNDILRTKEASCIVVVDGLSALPEYQQDELLDLLGIRNYQSPTYGDNVDNSRFKYIVASDYPTNLFKDNSHFCELKVGDMTDVQAGLALEIHLQAMKRTITSEQLEQVKKAIGDGKPATYVKLLADYLATLSSWESMEEIPEDLTELTCEYIDWTTTKNHHNMYMAWLALTLLSLNDGIEDWELIELLSTDEYVRQKFNQNSKHEYMGEVAVPPIYWHRLSYDLGNIVGIRQCPYGTVNAILRKDVRDAILDTVESIPSFNNQGQSLRRHAAQLLFEFYRTRWSKGNLHGLYNMPWYCVCVDEPMELYDLFAENLDYILGITKFSKQHIDYCISQLSSYRSGDGTLFINGLGKDVPTKLNYLRSWLLRNKDIGYENLRLSASNCPSDTIPYQASIENHQDSRVWNNWLRNSLNDNDIVFTSAQTNYRIEAVSEDAQRVLYLSLDHTSIKILDRTSGRYYSWSVYDDQRTKNEGRIKFVATDAHVDYVAIAFQNRLVIVRPSHKEETPLCYKIPFEVNALAMAHLSNRVAVCYGSGVYCFNFLNPSETYQVYTTGKSLILSACFDRRGHSLAILQADSTLIIQQLSPTGQGEAVAYSLGQSSSGDDNPQNSVNTPSQTSENSTNKVPSLEELIRNQILSHEGDSTFLILDGIPTQLYKDESNSVLLRQYPILKNNLTGAGADAAVYQDADKRLVCSTVDSLVYFEGMKIERWCSVPTLKFITLNGRYGVTLFDEIIDIHKASKDSFQIKDDRNDQYGVMESGVSALTADNMGDWMVESAGVRHDDNCPLILSVDIDYQSSEPRIVHKIILPPYQNNLPLPTVASAVSPDGGLCACILYDSDTIELALLDKQLNAVAHTLSDPRICSSENDSVGMWVDENIRRLLWTSDSKYLVGVAWHHIANANGAAFVFNPRGEVIRRFVDTKYTDYSTGVFIPQSINASGRYLLSDSVNSRVVDLETETLLGNLSCENEPLWHPCGNIFFVVSEGNLIVFDINTLASHSKVSDSNASDSNALDSNVPDILSSDSNASDIHSTTIDMRKGVTLMRGVEKILAISPSGRYAYVLCVVSRQRHFQDRGLERFVGPRKKNKILVRLDLSSSQAKHWEIPIEKLVCTYDDNYIVISSEHGQIQLRDANSGEVLKKAYGHVVRGWMQNTQKALFAAISGENPMMLAYPEELGVNLSGYATITRFWDYESRCLSEPKLVCPHCGHTFHPDSLLAEAIPFKKVTLENFSHAFSPLNQDARGFLSCDCPKCRMHILVNPFMA